MFKHANEAVGDIDWEEFHKELDSTVYIIHEIFESKKSFKKYLKKFYRWMKQGFEKPEVRKHPVRYKFQNSSSEPEKTMEIRHLIVNMMLWSAFIRYDCVDEINSSQIFDAENVTSDSLRDYINEHLVEPYRATIDAKEINKALDDAIYMLSQIYNDFALIMGLTMDMETFIELRDKYPRFGELLNTKPEQGMQPKEIEDMLDSRLSEYVDIITNQDKKNNLRPFIVTGEGLNKGQLSQLSIMGGLKPDIEGNVAPVPIDSNFINGGLDSISNFYIDGQAGSKPLILNKTVMGKSGYFSYKTMTLSSNYRISQTVDDCHSVHPVEYFIASKKHLKKIHNRYYVGENGELHRINWKKDDDLIGTTIALRDPVTCCSHDGICHICTGDLWYTNNNPAFHAGRFAATQINEPIQQKILSSKHMLKTVSDIITFSEGFERFFILDTNKIRLNMDSQETMSNWKLFIAEDDFYYTDESNAEEDFNTYIEKFYLVNTENSDAEPIQIKESCDRDLYLFGLISSLLKKDNVGDMYGKSLKLGDLSEEDAIAIVNVVNNELTTPLKNIMKLLDRKDHYGCETINDMVNKLVQLVIDSGMSVDAVHCSMMIRGLIRRADNILLPPDFSDPELSDEDYTILTVTNALIYNPSLTVSLSFDNANKQITDPMTYKKYRPSDYDLFFEEDLYDESRKFYKNKKKKKMIAKQHEYTAKYRKHKQKHESA